MHKNTTVDRIEVESRGTIKIRIAKRIIDDDGSVLSTDWHRTSIDPGEDIEAHMQGVNTNLAADLKMPPLGAEDIGRIRSQADAAWTPELIAAFQALR